MENVSVVAALLAGFLSFISPGVLPLVPGYLAFIASASIAELRAAGGSAGPPGPASAGWRAGPFGPARESEIGPARPDTLASRFLPSQTILSALLCVTGFSLMFIAFGATGTGIGAFIARTEPLLAKIAGLVVVLFGLRTMGLLQLGLLYNEKRLRLHSLAASALAALVMGLALAFGWTLRAGPILATIIITASAAQTVGRGVALLAFYALGLAIAFVLTAIAVSQFVATAAQIRRFHHGIEIASGAVLIVVGVLIFADTFDAIARMCSPYLPTF